MTQHLKNGVSKFEQSKIINLFFNPASIAVVGASRDPQKVGHQILANIISSGFNGEIYPLNPNSEAIAGLTAYKSILDIKSGVDLAIIAVPKEIVPDVLDEIGKKGTKAAVVISSGFKETGLNGKILEDRLSAIAASYGISLLGPNCMGIITPTNNLNLSFGPIFTKKGNISFLSQSGALGSAILDWAKSENLGFSNFVSLGNKANLSENDFITYLVQEKHTKVLALYLESLKNGRIFFENLKEISKVKPVIVFKAGKTEAGKDAASSHTGALAGESKIFSAAMKQAGVIEASTLEDFFLLIKTFSLSTNPEGKGIAIVTNAGGPGVIATDAAVKEGLNVEKLSSKTKSIIFEKVPGVISVDNPIDIQGDANDEKLKSVLEAVTSDEKINSIVSIITAQKETPIISMAKTISVLSKKAQKPIFGCFMGGQDFLKAKKILEENGVPAFSFPEEATHAIGAMYRYYLYKKRETQTPLSCKENKVSKILANFLRLSNQIRSNETQTLLVPEIRSFEILKSYNIPVCETERVNTVEDALKFQKKHKKIALKISSPAIIHRNRLNGVKLNLGTEEEVITAFNRLLRIRGFIVAQEMTPSGIEIIIGGQKDADFGDILMFGTGGVNTEDYADVAFVINPVSKDEIIDLISSTTVGKILNDKKRNNEVVSIIANVSCLLRNHQEIKELNINPLIITERKALVVDVKIRI